MACGRWDGKPAMQYAGTRGRHGKCQCRGLLGRLPAAGSRRGFRDFADESKSNDSGGHERNHLSLDYQGHVARQLQKCHQEWLCRPSLRGHVAGRYQVPPGLGRHASPFRGQGRDQLDAGVPTGCSLSRVSGGGPVRQLGRLHLFGRQADGAFIQRWPSDRAHLDGQQDHICHVQYR